MKKIFFILSLILLFGSCKKDASIKDVPDNGYNYNGFYRISQNEGLSLVENLRKRIVDRNSNAKASSMENMELHQAIWTAEATLNAINIQELEDYQRDPEAVSVLFHLAIMENIDGNIIIDGNAMVNSLQTVQNHINNLISYTQRVKYIDVIYEGNNESVVTLKAKVFLKSSTIDHCGPGCVSAENSVTFISAKVNSDPPIPIPVSQSYIVNGQVYLINNVVTVDYNPTIPPMIETDSLYNSRYPEETGWQLYDVVQANGVADLSGNNMFNGINYYYGTNNFCLPISCLKEYARHVELMTEDIPGPLGWDQADYITASVKGSPWSSPIGQPTPFPHYISSVSYLCSQFPQCSVYDKEINITIICFVGHIFICSTKHF
jgi:hypothetical protein